MHFRVYGAVEMTLGPEIIVVLDAVDFAGAAQHRLEEKQVPRDMLMNEIKRKQGMTKMVKHAHEDHEIELLAKLRDIISRQLAELDLEPVDLGGKFRLRQIVVVRVEPEHAVGAAA